jgi:hypothetical protein
LSALYPENDDKGAIIVPRYYWHPVTGKLEEKGTATAIRRAFKKKYGNIPYFVSKDFAKAYLIEKGIGRDPQKYVGGRPKTGAKKADVKRELLEVQAVWGAKKPLTDLATFQDIRKYTESLQKIKRKRVRKEIKIDDEKKLLAKEEKKLLAKTPDYPKLREPPKKITFKFGSAYFLCESYNGEETKHYMNFTTAIQAGFGRRALRHVCNTLINEAISAHQTYYPNHVLLEIFNVKGIGDGCMLKFALHNQTPIEIELYKDKRILRRL